MYGIVAYGAYVPYWSLQRSEIASVLGEPPGKGRRAVAGYDEDTTSMGVEAARLALSRARATDAGPIDKLYFATTQPAYLDKTNATAIHAALGLPAGCLAADMAGSVRSATAAFLAAAATGGLVVMSDIRTGRPGSADERDGGDGAAAFLFADAAEGVPVIAELVAEASVSDEFLDRWRIPGEPASRLWEERFGAERYLPLIKDAALRALAAAGVERADHVIVSSPQPRAARSAAAAFGEGSLAESFAAELGYAGAADAGMSLAGLLDVAGPGETVLLLVAADGCDAIVLRTTEAITDGAGRPAAGATLRGQLDHRGTVPYAAYLTWRGFLEREPPRRPDPQRPAAPPSARNEAWKFGFTGSRCNACGAVQLPPQRICVKCGAKDDMSAQPLANVPARVATFTVDRLAYSLAPPVVAAVLDFEGGGRFPCEMTDVDPEVVGIGDPVEMTFRRLFTAGGVHNYFWKARPTRWGAAGDATG